MYVTQKSPQTALVALLGLPFAEPARAHCRCGFYPAEDTAEDPTGAYFRRLPSGQTTVTAEEAAMLAAIFAGK
jgi:hypothetical protein